MMKSIYAFVLLCVLSQPVSADEVVRQAEAIYFLSEVQAGYLRKVDVSSEKVGAYAERRAQVAGAKANCRGVTSEQLPDEAEKVGAALVLEVGPLIDLLAVFSSDYITPPTLGAYRSAFLSGWGQGCTPTLPQDDEQIDAAFKAIEAIILIEKNIELRRQDIIRRLREQSE